MVGRYIAALLSVFFKWWWAALTGVFTIAGALHAFNNPVTITLGPLAMGSLLFIVGTVTFALFSVLTMSWRWYCASAPDPKVTQVIPEKVGKSPNPMIFLLAPGAEPLPAGSVVVVFRHMSYGAEACAAVLDVKDTGQDGTLKAQPRWISDMHKRDFQRGEVRISDIYARRVSGEFLSFLEKCIKEGVR